MRTRARFVFVIAVLTLVAAACGDDADTTAPMDMTTMDDMDDMDGESFAWGMPGDPADADRVVEIVASDAFRFDPDTVEVSAGETVTFRVTNAGAIRHEFVVGTQADQDHHEAEMTDMGGMEMADEANGFALEPGETKELTLTFTEAGSLQFACHETGHYAAGMIGDLTVQP
ncbi:MAG: plastocyanin/azurin family copper-binding protein [Acidimicrobiia bacterium]